MHNSTPPDDAEKGRHPLERERPAPPPSPEPSAQAPKPQRPRVTLHIATVRPYVTYGIIAVNILIFLVRILSREIDLNLLLAGANHPIDILQNGELYRLFTSMFLHASIYAGVSGFALQNALHLIFNMYILYAEGTRTEQMFGHVRFALVYFLGGLAGSILSTVLNDPNTYSLGASGAVFAVLGARIIFLYKHRTLFGAGGRSEMNAVIQLVVINLVFGLFTSFASAGGLLGRVDNFAHMGGAVGGALLAWLISPFFVLRTHPDQPLHMVAQDINPLRNRYRDVTLFSIGLMAILLFARFNSG